MQSDVKNAVTRCPTDPASEHTGRSVNVLIPLSLPHTHVHGCKSRGKRGNSSPHNLERGTLMQITSPVSDFVVFQNFKDQIACITFTMQKSSIFSTLQILKQALQPHNSAYSLLLKVHLQVPPIGTKSYNFK